MHLTLRHSTGGKDHGDSCSNIRKWWDGELKPVEGDIPIYSVWDDLLDVAWGLLCALLFEFIYDLLSSYRNYCC